MGNWGYFTLFIGAKCHPFYNRLVFQGPPCRNPCVFGGSSASDPIVRQAHSSVVMVVLLVGTLYHIIHGKGIFTHMSGLFCMVNAGKCTIHGLFGYEHDLTFFHQIVLNLVLTVPHGCST